MNHLSIYLIALPIIFIVGFILYIKKKTQPFLVDDKQEVDFDAENALDKANKTVENINRLVDNKREIDEEMKEVYKRSREPP